MSEEFKYIPYNPYDKNIRGLVKQGGVYSLRNARLPESGAGYSASLSGLLLPDRDADMTAMLRDAEYMKEMYPDELKAVGEAVSDECDHLEYEGSPMFAEYPDREEMRRVARDVYDRLDGENLISDAYKAVGSTRETVGDGVSDAAAGLMCHGDPGCGENGRPPQNRPPQGRPPYGEPPYIPDGPGCGTCIMRNIIELLVCDEFCMRRERYRRHRRRFF